MAYCCTIICQKLKFLHTNKHPRYASADVFMLTLTGELELNISLVSRRRGTTQ